MDRPTYLETIRKNIETSGQHITMVTGAPLPRYAYTIGLVEHIRAELCLAGALKFLREDVHQALDLTAAALKRGARPRHLEINTNQFGRLRLQKMHPSWSRLMMLGVFDYLKISSFDAYQIMPDQEFLTLDVPNMSRPWSSKHDPGWKWLKEPWEFTVSESITVTTNLDVLKGNPVTEVMRWESEEWEMFAGGGPDINKSEIRVVPLGLLLAIDASLLPALDLKVGKGMWRENQKSKWQDWTAR